MMVIRILFGVASDAYALASQNVDGRLEREPCPLPDSTDSATATTTTLTATRALLRSPVARPPSVHALERLSSVGSRGMVKPLTRSLGRDSARNKMDTRG